MRTDVPKGPRFLLVLLGAGLYSATLAGPSEQERSVEYCNPIINRYLADPFILTAGGKYYLFATGKAKDGRFIQIYCSDDLARWEFVRGAVAKGKKGTWNRKNFWAPEVMEINGRFHLYYTASTEDTPKNTGNRVGLAVSDRPDGPYEDVGVVIPDASLDGSPFRDADGTLYMYYTIEHGSHAGLKAGRIYVDRMASPERVEGKPSLVLGKYHWQEGACMVHRHGKYYLTFSTGGWRTANYHVRCAMGRSATGPFAEQKDRLLQATDDVKGPGHHALFRDAAGHDWIVYHGWDPEFKARYPRIDPLLIMPGGMTTIGPTSTPQTIGPGCWQAANRRMQPTMVPEEPDPDR